MSTDLRKYINVISEALAPGSYTTQKADMAQKTLSDQVLETEKAIDKLIETGVYQGEQQQIHDEQGNPVAGQYVVTIDINFTFFQTKDEMVRVRIPDERIYFDVTSPIKKSDVRKFLELLVQKYQKAGWRAKITYGGGEQGWLRISHNISSTAQG